MYYNISQVNLEVREQRENGNCRSDEGPMPAEGPVYYCTVRATDSRYLSQISWTSPLTYTRADGQNACCRTDLGSSDHSGGAEVISGGRIVDDSDDRGRFSCVLRSISE